MFTNKKIVRNIFKYSVFALIISMLFVRSTVARTMVYISNADSREIYVLELNQKSGDLKLVEKVSVSGSVMPLTVSPDRKYLFASLRSEPYSVSSYAISTNGKLKLIKTTPLADNMAYISTDRSGRFLFGASYSGSKISVSKINSNGEIEDNPSQIIPTGRNAHCILTDLSNKFVFVSNLGDDRLMQFKFEDSNGHLEPNQIADIKTKKGAGPRHFVFHPIRRFVFGINELDGTVSVYSLNSLGMLSEVGSYSVMPPDSSAKAWAADIHISPNGRFLYASERTTNTIAAFRINERNGKLNLFDNYLTEKQPRGFNIDPTGNFLLVAGQKSNRLSIYKINQRSGVLSKKGEMPLGENPNWVEIINLPE